ncbi:MAG: carbohydrate ABC transporter permease [Saccharofermentanales bacterium]
MNTTRLQSSMSAMLSEQNRKKIGNKLRSRHWWVSKGFSFAAFILLCDLTFIFLYPFLHILVTSVKSPADINNLLIRWIPGEIYLQNYRYAFQSLMYFKTSMNSVWVTSLSTFGHLIGCSFTAYGLSRYKFRINKLAFIIVIMTIIVPIQTIITPIYLIFSKIGFVGNPLYLGLILPTYFGFGLKGGLFIFIFYSYFQTLPKALEEAAMIDGAGPLKTFFKIIVPTSSSAYLISTVLSVVWHWNDFFEPSLYITESVRFLLPQMLPALYSLVDSAANPKSIEQMELKNIYTGGVLMAGTSMAVLPVMIFYIFVQKKFIAGIERSGLTGE